LSQEETRKKEEERVRNEEFEKNNEEFCGQVLEDMSKRNKATLKKQESAESLRLKGNKFFKRKEYDTALENYMEALKLTPYDTKTLLNIAQVTNSAYSVKSVHYNLS
jgi:tetratricopeptide (TPR) repeat protein